MVIVMTVGMGGKTLAQSTSPRWERDDYSPQPPQLEAPTSVPSDPDDPLSTNLTAAELEQTILALEIIQKLGLIDDISGIRELQNQLETRQQEQQVSYQLSQSQTRQLQSIFSRISAQEIAAINKILLSQKAETSLQLSPIEIQGLLDSLQNVPMGNLTPRQEQQLAVIVEFLQQLPQEQTVSLNQQQVSAFQTAVEFVFFISDRATAQVPTIAPSPQVTLTPTQLQEILVGLRGLQQANLRPNQQEEINRLLRELTVLQQRREGTVELSVAQTETLRSLFGSLSANEIAAIELLLLGDRAPEQINLSSTEIQELLTFFQNIPSETLSETQRQQREEIVQFLTEIREQAPLQLSAAQTQALLQSVQILIFDRSAIARSRLSLAQLQNLINYLKLIQTEVSLPPRPTQSLRNLVDELSNLEPNPNNQFLLTQNQTEQVNTIINSLNRRQRNDLQRSLVVEAGGSVVSPAISVLTPIGYGNSWGNIGLGLSYQERTRFSDNQDGSLTISMGFGDPESSVGFDTSLAIFSLTNRNQSGAFETGGLSFKLSRNLPSNSAISLGVENLITWPEGNNDSGTSTYLVGSTLFQLREDPFSPLGLFYVSAGLGNGRFRPPEDFDPIDDGLQFNFFANATLQILPQVNLITEWTGQDLSAGLSVAPFRRVPLIITLAFIDLTGNAEESFGNSFPQKGNPRFTGAVSYSIFF